MVVSGEGKGPEEKFGSDDFQEEDRKGTTVIVSKIAKTMSKPRWLEIAGQVPTEPVYGRDGIRHTGGLSLEEATVGNVGNLASLLTEKLQVD